MSVTCGRSVVTSATLEMFLDWVNIPICLNLNILYQVPGIIINSLMVTSVRSRRRSNRFFFNQILTLTLAYFLGRLPSRYHNDNQTMRCWGQVSLDQYSVCSDRHPVKHGLQMTFLGVEYQHSTGFLYSNLVNYRPWQQVELVVPQILNMLEMEMVK